MQDKIGSCIVRLRRSLVDISAVRWQEINQKENCFQRFLTPLLTEKSVLMVFHALFHQIYKCVCMHMTRTIQWGLAIFVAQTGDAGRFSKCPDRGF